MMTIAARIVACEATSDLLRFIVRPQAWFRSELSTLRTQEDCRAGQIISG